MELSVCAAIADTDCCVVVYGDCNATLGFEEPQCLLIALVESLHEAIRASTRLTARIL